MSGIYIHIPFCQQRCIYCDFHSGTNRGLIQRYLDALCKEMVQRATDVQGVVETLYLGGGTPSLLSAANLSQIFNTLSSNYDLSHVQEVTMECNPDDLNSTYIESLKEFPINRLSIGVQSFNDTELKFLNRRHTAQEAIDAIKACREAGFENISIDLMYALPGQTAELWGHTLDVTEELNLEHISAYSLMYEDGTALTSRLKRGVLQPLSDEDSVALFEQMMTRLKRCGYEQYEISNFAKPGYYSRHNSSYWHGVPYLGFGAAAHSYSGKQRFWNVANTGQYCECIEHDKPCSEGETMSINEQFNEMVFTSLRTAEGIDMELLEQKFGSACVRELEHTAAIHINGGLLKREGKHLHLTEQGIYVSDGVMSDLMRVE